MSPRAMVVVAGMSVSVAALLGVGAGKTMGDVAQVAPGEAPGAVGTGHGLPNFDVRLEADGTPVAAVRAALAKHAKTAAYQQDMARLRGAVPFVAVDEDGILGTAQFVRSWSQMLTEARAGAKPLDVVRGFVKDYAGLMEIDAAEVDAARVTRDFVTDHNGVRHLTLQQLVRGVDLYDAGIKANVSADGRLINISSTMLTRPAGDFAVADWKLTDLEAIRAGAASVGVDVKTDPEPDGDAAGAGMKRRWKNSADFRQDQAITTERVVFPMTRDELRPAWFVIVPVKGEGHTYELVVDATDGRVLHRQDELCFDSTQPVTLRAYPKKSPIPGLPGGTGYPFDSRVLITVNPSDVTAFSPNGWINDGGMETLGNNVDAHLDLNADNVPDQPRPNGGAARVFDFPLSNALNPSGWRSAAVANAFYLANTYHDRLYALGFNEAAGNFQTSNFGRGGAQNDPVQLDCQDGSGTNNANFGTPADGSSGRCQMYLWTTTPQRDGDLDADVLFHELTHGLSNRLTGGPANSGALNNTQSGGMGEGWSDFVALCLLSLDGEDPAASHPVATYVIANYNAGLRRRPYSTSLSIDPLTWDAYGTSGTTSYGITRSTEVHNTGEIWCTTLWECRGGLVDVYGFAGNDMILRLVVNGMKLQPANPSFSQARDAILQADLADYGGANQLILWKAFAKRGLGFSYSGGASSSTATPTLGTDVPPYAENGDAGDLAATARVVAGTGSVAQITGTLAANDVDVYRISVCDRTTFSASTVGGASFDTQLFLFDASGMPVAASDDAAGGQQSQLSSTFVLANGDYYLAISASGREPVSAAGLMWLNAPIAVERAADGPGAGGALTGWTGTVDPAANGAYTITLTGACAATAGHVPLGALAMSAYGSPTPNVVQYPGATTAVFRLQVVPATQPASTGITVSLDALSLGIGPVTLLDNGVSPDVTAGDRNFAASRSVPVLAPGNYNLPWTAMDAQGRSVQGTMLFTVVDQSSACCLSNGACVFQSGLACQTAGGVYRSGAIACDVHPCGTHTTEVEPNDTVATATNASQNFERYGGSLYHMGFTGNIASSTDLDYYRIGALQVGDVITLSERGSASGSGTCTDPLVRLYRAGQAALVVSDDDSGAGLDALVYRYPITVADTYYIRGYRANSTNTGTYTMGVQLENAGTAPNTGGTFAGETEPNESVSAANDASSAWREVRYINTAFGTIATTSDQDHFSYQFSAGDVVTVTVFSTSGLDPKVALLDATGAVVVSDDGTDVGPDSTSPLYGVVIPASGTYAVRVGSASGTGSYLATVYLSTDTAPALPCDADFNRTGALTVQDIFDYLGAWFAADPRADVNGSGSVTVQDIFDFLAAWFGGC